ncbi:MAG: D-glycero-beta-D-manno-heptose 1-phosphate adenylyltransferase [Armatimonadetes bacterium]|nr:D-glycero-beta-D-manno-heptose 1-phosphate adenylyltransferase [Armatimonadota bacterium]MBS1702804.1 D-glycero-beta-D-manno-heptose 1-phosphate adenylyltransferase [Armatimonadota bacterium]
MTIEELQAKRGKSVVVFTNGVFDILHAGHVDYLEKARALGDYLVVALNTDRSVSRLKGPTRPINHLADRVRVIGALRCVDCVVTFSEDTPERIIAAIRPNIHVKGGDYTVESLPESKIVHSYGGKVVIFPLLEGRSSTRVIQKLDRE